VYPPLQLLYMSSPIDKKTLEHLAELARLELKPDEEEKLLRDLQKILEHFEELKNIDMAGIEPMSGGTHLTNVFRDDEKGENTNIQSGTKAFPITEDGFLKIPPVFSAEGGSASRSGRSGSEEPSGSMRSEDLSRSRTTGGE